MGIAHAQAPLLGRIDEEQATERPECLSAEALLSLLLDDDDALAGFRDLRRGDEAGKPGADHDHVGIEPHAPSSFQPSSGPLGRLRFPKDQSGLRVFASIAPTWANDASAPDTPSPHEVVGRVRVGGKAASTTMIIGLVLNRRRRQ